MLTSMVFFTPGHYYDKSVRKIDLSPFSATAQSRNNRRVVHRVRTIRETTYKEMNVATGDVLATYVERVYVSDCGGWTEETVPYQPPAGSTWTNPLELDLTGTQEVTCFSCLKRP